MQRIGLNDLCKAIKRARAVMEDNGVTPLLLPEACPFTLEDLIGRLDAAALVARLDDVGANGPA